jgi:hypothetical protein
MRDSDLRGGAVEQQQFLSNNYHQQRVLDRRGNNGGGSSQYNDVMDNNSEGGLNSAEALFLDSIKNGGSSGSGGVGNNLQKQKSSPPPGFSTSFLASSNASGKTPGSPPHTGGGNDSLFNFGSLDRQTIGENLVRSHSAAPTFDARMSGGIHHHSLGSALTNRETPVVSNRSTTLGSDVGRTNPRGGGGFDSYLETSLSDRSHILQLGQRRPASTGIIGDHHHVTTSSSVLESLGLGSGSGGGSSSSHLGTTNPNAVRPAAKTLMDLIQEDYPPESPFDTTGDLYATDYQREMGCGLERPRTTSPMSSSIQNARDQHYRHQQQQNHREQHLDSLANISRGGVDPDHDFRRSIDQFHLTSNGGDDNYSERYYDQQNIVQQVRSLTQICSF